MAQEIMANNPKKALHIREIFFIILVSIWSSNGALAQQPFGCLFNPLFSPLYYKQDFLNPDFGSYFFSGYSIHAPAIRQTAFMGEWYRSNWNLQNLRPAIPAPRPVIRQAAATITILITQGPTQALLVYNPTILFGQSAPTIIPTALTLPALLGGNPLIFGSAPITSSNLAIFNYVANNLLLPSGIALYIIP